MELGLNLVMVRPELVPSLAVRAEQLGYESVFVPDHLAFPVEFASRYPGTPDGSFPFPRDAPLYEPWLVLGSIAAATSTIRLGTAVYLLALRHPLVTARAVSTLDALSGGRVLLGIGVGWLREEYAALGIDPATRGARTDEAIAALRALWTEPEPSFAGDHFAFPPLHFEPKPLARPHPPILVGGDSDAALRRAARLGDGWISGGVSPVAEVEARVARVRARREESGATGPFDVTVLFADPTTDDLAQLRDLAVDRVVVRPWTRARDAGDAIARFADWALPVARG